MQKVSISEYLSREERKELMEKNNWLAISGIVLHWLYIIAAFMLVYFWTNPLTIFISLFILGGQQLACAILMHDAAHQAVFKNVKLNNFVGRWFGAYPVFQNIEIYRPYHLKHHVNTGLEDDPDLLLTRGYPTSRKSMFRKITRDLTGQTGIKFLIGLVLIYLEYYSLYSQGGKLEPVSQKNRSWKAFFKVFSKNMGGPLLANFILFALLTIFLSPWLYLLWVVAFFTTFQFSLRVRSIAEHSMLQVQDDPFLNTRTTYANWFERILFAPYYVNYHAEHHALMSVPPYNFPKMHRLLKSRGFYEIAPLEKGYWKILKMTIHR